MLPLRDDIPTRRFPVITATLITLNALVFFVELLLQAGGSLEEFFMRWGVIPSELTQQFGFHALITLLTSLFLHGGFMHIVGNMLYLWIFGNNVEDAMGRVRFAIFYLLCGVLAGLAQVAADPHSAIPTIGASGAIAGVLGAYLILFPRARVATLIFLGIFARIANLPAVLVLIFWFLLQLLNGVLAVSTFESGGVAWFAHIGGFVAGMVLVWLFARRPRPAAPTYPLEW